MHVVSGDPIEQLRGGPARPAARPAETVKTDSSKAAFLSMPVPVLVVAAGGTITLCNKAAGALLGVDADDVEGRQVEHVLLPLDELERLATGGARAVFPCDRGDGSRARIAARVGRYPQWSPRAARVIVLEDAGHVAEADDAPFEVAEVLQMAALARRTLVVDVLEGDSLYGRIVMVEGQPWCARDALDGGVAAFRRLAFRSAAHATCMRLRGEPPPRNIDLPLEHLLLDAARVRDEELAHREVVPSPADPWDVPADDDGDDPSLPMLSDDALVPIEASSPVASPPARGFDCGSPEEIGRLLATRHQGEEMVILGSDGELIDDAVLAPLEAP